MRVQTKLNWWVAGMAAVCLLAPASGVRAETSVLDNPILMLLPAVKNMPAPAWVKPGLRMTYHYFSESTDGKTTTSGEGFQEMDVVAPLGPWVPGAVSLYFTDGTITTPLGSYYCLYTPGAGAWWVNPAALKDPSALQPPRGFLVTTGPYTVDGVTYDTLQVQYLSTTGHHKHKTTTLRQWIYDRKLGTLLVQKDDVDSPAMFSETVAIVAQVRQLKVPWPLTTAPACAARAQLNYQGTWTMYPPGGSPYQLPMTLVATRTGGTGSYTQYQVTSTVQGAEPTTATNLTGVAQLHGGYWMTPKALASLKVGQVLEQDPITQVKLSVQRVSASPRKTVYLAQTGQGFTTWTGFDYQTGTGVYVKVSQLFGGVPEVVELSLVGSPVGSPGAQGEPLALALTAAATPARGGATQITVSLSRAATAEVTLLNLAGREVAILPAQSLPAGVSTLLWDGKSVSGAMAPAGRYLARVTVRDADGDQAQALASLLLGR